MYFASLIHENHSLDEIFVIFLIGVASKNIWKMVLIVIRSTWNFGFIKRNSSWLILHPKRKIDNSSPNWLCQLFSRKVGLRLCPGFVGTGHICIALYKEHSAFYITDTVDIGQCTYVAAANQRQLRHSNTQNRTYGLGNRWLSHSSFAQFSNEPSG